MRERETEVFYDFGPFRLNVKKQRLTRGEQIIPLTPKEFELLMLAEIER